MWSNIKWFCIWYDNDWGKICIRCYNHKSHPISRPPGRAMGCLWIWVKIDHVITAPHCMLISSTNDDVLCSGLMLELISPSDAIWRQRYRWTLAEVMASCLAAPSHYLKQCLLTINVFFGIHMMAIWHAFLKIPIHDMSTAAPPRGWWLNLL